MSRLLRWLVAPAALLVTSLLATAPAYARDGLQQCLDKAIDHNGEPPTCTQTANGTWVASWPDDQLGSGGGIPGTFVALVVLAIIAGIAITIWKVTTARTLARQSGMSPGLATTMTLLTDDGLDATYLAANLRGSQQAQTAPAAPPSPPAAPAPASGRLEELKGLLDRGLVTQAEYDARRQAIIDSV
jgi:hypothetical protein